MFHKHCLALPRYYITMYFVITLLYQLSCKTKQHVTDNVWLYITAIAKSILTIGGALNTCQHNYYFSSHFNNLHTGLSSEQ